MNMKLFKFQTKKQRNIWFNKVRGSYLPCSWQGWLLYIPFILFLVVTLVEASRGNRSTAGILYFIFPQFIAATATMHWIAARFTKE